jgi:acyl-CoA reductase-like NAD-dependent aldehyde dehydrogenase
VIAFPLPTAADPAAEVPALLALLAETHPTMALAMAHALGGADSPALSATSHRLVEALAADSLLGQEVDAVVARADKALAAFENWTDQQIDALLFDIATLLAGRAEELAIVSASETGLGNVADKTLKIRFASLDVYRSLAGQVAQGVLSVDEERRVTEIASPVGVVFAVAPVTNPVATAIFKMLIAIKGRNATILSFHRQALRVGRLTCGIVRDALKAHGAPADLVQWVAHPSRKATRRFMGHEGVSLVLATGGQSLVEAAYSSGTPAIGVGPGNAPAWICPDANLEDAARAIVASKTFDNGLICGAEHNLVVDAGVAAPFVEALVAEGAAILTPVEARRFAAQVIDRKTGALLRDFVGQSAQVIAGAIGLVRTFPIRLLVVPATFSRSDRFSTGEKLAPVLSMFTVDGEDEGLKLCQMLLEIAGAGHTAVIHSTNAARIERFARVIPAGRILVNSPAAQGCCGMTTGLACSMTLGCGTFGGNSTTDNVTFRHLLNVKRVAYPLELTSAARSAMTPAERK